MKLTKNDWLFLGATAAYSYLFYEQAAGINYLLFTLILLGLVISQTRTWVFKKTSWQLAALACLVSAVNVVVVNSGLAVLANIVSVVLLAGFSRMPQSSIFIAALNSLYSLATSFFNFTFFREKFFPESRGGAYMLAGFNANQVFIVGVPVVITAFFLVIYCSASAAFSHLVARIDLSFISVSWVLFTFVGFWLIFGLLRQQLVEPLTDFDLATGNKLQRVRLQHSWAFKMLELKSELKAGIILLVMLNGLLFVFNLSDIFYLTIGTLPKDIIYSEYLHQGVNMLIFSILLAIGVLLYLFRGNQNFFAKNRPLKFLAYGWLAQNLILVMLTLSKNSIYVLEFGLTHKRIGVYTYLILTLIGLVTSFIKVAAVKNNWFLFRKNAWAAYLVLVIASSLNWDRVITSHNLHFTAKPDLNYLLTLSDSGFGLVYQFVNAPQNHQPEFLKKRVNNHRNNVLARIENRNWQAWNYDDFRIAQELKVGQKTVIIP